MRFDRNSLKAHLEAAVDPGLADFTASLVPGDGRPMLGIRIPQLRKLARKIAKEDWRTILAEAITTETFEEVLLQGFVIGYADMEWDERIGRIGEFKPLIDNWAVCDCCCASFTAARRHREELWPLLRTDMASGMEFRQRFAAVMLMDHFMSEEYIERVLDELAALVPAGYYASFGAAWAVQACFAKFPEQTLARLLAHVFAEDVQRLACKKILESRRTPADIRPLIRVLGKKKGGTRK